MCKGYSGSWFTAGMGIGVALGVALWRDAALGAALGAGLALVFGFVGAKLKKQ